VTPITLASTSASRAAILRAAGIAFQTVAPGVDESAWKNRLLAGRATPAQVASVLADEKARAVSSGVEGLVIGADQTLELDGRLYDKTETLAETRARLELLRGRAHSLHTAAAVARGGAVLWRWSGVSVLMVRPFSEAFLDVYLQHQGAAVASSVGAYHLESLGAQLFDTIQGDYFSILGLPLIPLLAYLREAGGLLE
jgi:septum formation protein